MKIRPIRTEILHVVGRTKEQTAKYDEVDSRFSQFYKRV
jgi:hypothetical protein